MAVVDLEAGGVVERGGDGVVSVGDPDYLEREAFVPYSDIMVGGITGGEETQFESALVRDYGLVRGEGLAGRNGV